MLDVTTKRKLDQLHAYMTHGKKEGKSAKEEKEKKRKEEEKEKS